MTATGSLTVESMVADLRDLGVEPGDTVLVHSSLSAIGWVCGDAQAAVEGLLSAVGDDGTLATPTFSTQYSDPTAWSNPPVPDDWIDTIRTERPTFRPEVTPTRGMGAIPECFRNYPGVHRSNHPEYSVAARGPAAEAITADHELDYGLGENSPLSRIYEQDGDVLLLGVGHGVNSSLHLAEHRADLGMETVTNVAPVLDGGERALAEYEDVPTRTDDFPEVGAAFEQEVGVTQGTVGAADAKLIDQPSVVEFAVDWFEANR